MIVDDPKNFTPEATIGPFYPGTFVASAPQDLWNVAPLVAHRPQGRPILFVARFIDSMQRPVPSLVVEFWQANAHGRYRHPLDVSDAPLDPQFDGFARLRTSDEGILEFHTIKPGAYPVPGQTGIVRAPHLRLTVFASGIDRLYTEVFFADEAASNASDPLLQSIADPALRDRLIARPREELSSDGARVYDLDLVMRGERETPFLEGPLATVVVNDRESETRTPASELHPIPATARDPFTAIPTLPALRPGEGDLTRLAPGRPQASGEAIVITGRILDEDLRPVRQTLVEVWNANAFGRYSHVIDAGRNDAPLDPNFYGFGQLLTNDEGMYAVRTIKPGAYIARRDIGWWRPPHVHFSIVGSGVRLVTQMYFPGDPLNEKDFIFQIVPEDARERVIGRPLASVPEASGFHFDIVIRGRFQTPPDAD